MVWRCVVVVMVVMRGLHDAIRGKVSTPSTVCSGRRWRDLFLGLMMVMVMMMSMGMVMVVMARLRVLGAFRAADPNWRATTVALVFEPIVLVLDSLWSPPILGAHSLQSEVFVEIRAWREALLRILGHWAATRGGGAAQTTQTRKHSPKLALHVWIFAHRQWLCLRPLHSLRERRGSTGPPIDIGAKIQE